MEKTIASLVLTLVVCMMGIPLAFIAGQQSVQANIDDRINRTMERSREEQRELIAALREELGQANPNAQALKTSPTVPALEQPVQTYASLPLKTARALETEAPAISSQRFLAAGAGMTYEQVVAAFGREGFMTLSLEEEAGSVTERYIWKWRNADGSPGRIDALFQDGRLETKTYAE